MRHTLSPEPSYRPDFIRARDAIQSSFEDVNGYITKGIQVPSEKYVNHELLNEDFKKAKHHYLLMRVPDEKTGFEILLNN